MNPQSLLLTLKYAQSDYNHNHELTEYIILVMDKDRNIIDHIYNKTKDPIQLANEIKCINVNDIFTFGDNKILHYVGKICNEPLLSFIDIRKSRADGYRHHIDLLNGYKSQISSKKLKLLNNNNNDNDDDDNTIPENTLDSISNLCWLLAKNLVTYFDHNRLTMNFSNNNNNNNNNDIIKLCKINRLHLIFLESATNKIKQQQQMQKSVELEMQKLLLQLVYGDDIFDKNNNNSKVIHMINNLKNILPIYKIHNVTINHDNFKIIKDIYQFTNMNKNKNYSNNNNNNNNVSTKQKLLSFFFPQL